MIWVANGITKHERYERHFYKQIIQFSKWKLISIGFYFLIFSYLFICLFFFLIGERSGSAGASVGWVFRMGPAMVGPRGRSVGSGAVDFSAVGPPGGRGGGVGGGPGRRRDWFAGDAPAVSSVAPLHSRRRLAIAIIITSFARRRRVAAAAAAARRR